MCNKPCFEGSYTFQDLIKHCCQYHEWSIGKLNNKSALIKFKGSKGQTHSCYILQQNENLEFSVPTGLIWQSLNEIPDQLSSYLLHLNSKKMIGFWVYEEVQDRYVLSRMHNQQISLVYSDAEYFGQIIQALTLEVDQLESNL